MLRSAVGKVMWVGRATVFLVGLAVILALMIGAATTALAHSNADNKLFHLGHRNSAATPTSLISTLADAAKSALVVQNKSGGPALDLKVGNATTPAREVAPMKVNSPMVVTSLNADKLDGQDASSFAPKAAEPWHEVNTAGEPAFENRWSNGGAVIGNGPYSRAAFYKDPYGVVHLKGLLAGPSTPSVIFSLPCGYGPAQEEWHATYTRGADGNDYLGRVEIRPTLCDDGSYRADVVAGRGYSIPFSIDGITFRATEA